MIARGCANAAERACVLAGTLSPVLAALRLRPSFGPTAIGSPINTGDDLTCGSAREVVMKFSSTFHTFRVRPNPASRPGLGTNDTWRYTMNFPRRKFLQFAGA